MRMRGATGILMAIVAVAAAGTAAAAPTRMQRQLSSLAMWEAERDFDAMRTELGLSGSAPLVGLEEPVANTKAAKKARQLDERRALRRSAINKSTMRP
jgi:hypothetical protein